MVKNICEALTGLLVGYGLWRGWYYVLTGSWNEPRVPVEDPIISMAILKKEEPDAKELE